MSKCTNPDIGDFLHAYELNVLSEEDTERFETHLLECEFCFEQIQSFERETNLLVLDQAVKELIRKSVVAEESLESESFLKKLWRYIWPETPLFFKPALAYLLILLMILPAYYGLRKSTETGTGIRPIVQTISLNPFRSAEPEVLKISDRGDALISFVYTGAKSGEVYHVVIEYEDGKTIYKNDSFKEFNDYGAGQLRVPLAKMKPGDYHLTITDPRAKPPLNKQEYTFRIEK